MASVEGHLQHIQDWVDSTKSRSFSDSEIEAVYLINFFWLDGFQFSVFSTPLWDQKPLQEIGDHPAFSDT